MDHISKAKGLNFEKQMVNKPTMVEFYKRIAAMRIFICPCGSIADNAILLHEGQGFITLNANTIDTPNLKQARDTHVWHISLIHQNMEHYGRSGNANEARLSVCIDIVLYAVENQRWPSNHKLLEPFNYEIIKEEYRLNSTLRYPEISHKIIAEYAKHVDVNELQI